ncbi:hypothetical protein ACP275_11G024600 [Erythranthe tilingii]
MDKKVKTKFEDEKKKPAKEEEEEEEEALSLCDLPLNSGEPPAEKIDSNFKTQDYKRRSSSEPSEFFEFFHGFVSDEISDADDIIFRGKILPYCKNRQPRTHNNHHGGGHIHHHQILIKSLSADDANYTEDDDRLPRRSYFELTTTRNTHRRRSTDCKKFRWSEPTSSDTHRSSSKISSAAKSEGWKVISKSKWIGLMMFGPVKIQQEMDLRDMKNRQIRRPNTGSMFAGGKVPARGNDRRRISWGHDLIRVLSCKNHASVAVSSSIGHVPSEN